jgi:hypothetical protein
MGLSELPWATRSVNVPKLFGHVPTLNAVRTKIGMNLAGTVFIRSREQNTLEAFGVL